LNEQHTASRSANHAAAEQPAAQALSFVVRIWRQGGPSDRECRGWIEHVQSGRRTSFSGLDQLRYLIADAVGSPVYPGRSWSERLKRWRTFVSEWFSDEQEDEA
jgi:hypothetical protein